jgi:tetratricopeptide (TPR) repeat protein
MPGHVVKGLLPSERVSVPVATASVPDPPPAAPPIGAADAEAVARLRALGYIGAVTTSLARVNLGEIDYRKGRLDAAERELRAVLDSQPDNLAALLWLAKTLRGQGKSREALAVYQRAVRRDPGSGEAIVEAADLAASSGLAAEATRLVAETPPTPRNAGAIAVAQAILARAGGDAALAERKLRSALALDPTSIEALSRLLDLTAGTPRLAGALPLFRRGAALAPASPRHVALLGEALLATGDATGAEAQLGRALVLAPDATPARLDLARAQLRRGAAERALATLDAAPPSHERALLRGATLSALERWPDAAREYRAALEMTPRPSPELLNGLAWAELKSGRKGEAAALLGRSLAARRDQPEIRRLLEELGASPRP